MIRKTEGIGFNKKDVYLGKIEVDSSGIRNQNKKREMKAVALKGRNIRVEERPDPVPAKGEALIKVAKAGICSTDLELVNEIQLLGSRCGSFAKALEFLKKEALELEGMVDADFPLENAQKAFERAKNPEVIKVLLTP